MDFFAVIRIALLATLAFCVTILWTPALTHFLYQYRLGKKIRDAASAPIMSALHAHKAGTPTMGGILIWGTTAGLAVVFWLLGSWFDTWWSQVNFLSRSQTLLPLGALVAAALVGLFDDWCNVRGLGPRGGGIRLRHKLFFYALIAAVGAWWFSAKLGWDTLHLPFLGDLVLGWWYVPVFLAVIIGTAFSVNQTDGLDGLAGGTLAAAFGAFGAIAFAQGRYDLAAFCGVIVGSMIGFLWFNIPPARFFMGDTGSMSLGITLGIVAFITNTVFLLPVIGFLFVVEALSTIIQLTSKKLFKRKVFRSSPIHHHLEAIGWPESKIVMRFWVVGGVAAIVGVVLFLIDRTS